MCKILISKETSSNSNDKGCGVKSRLLIFAFEMLSGV